MDDEATALFQTYKTASKDKQHWTKEHERAIEWAAEAQSKDPLTVIRHNAFVIQRNIDRKIANEQFETAQNASKKHYEENAAAYHDLGVISAHMAGVTINVEQPVEIGQQVPVRVEHPEGQ